MIELKSVEVWNFRSFSHALFEPLGMGQGLTAINGTNGSGKSSLATYALIWALYGQTPNDVPVKSLRRQGSEGEVKVTVTFRHDEQTIVVSRALRGRNDTTAAAISVDGLEQTNVSARTATAWVVSRLGVTAEAFITAFVVRQKEVDGLVKARPAERRALVERLAGIDRMSAAVKEARDHARSLAAVAAVYPAVSNVEALDEEAVKLRNNAVAAQKDLDDVREFEANVRDKLKFADEAWQAATKTQSELVNATHSCAVAKNAYDVAVTQLSKIRVAAEGADSLADAESATEDAREAVLEAERVVRVADESFEVAGRLESSARVALEEAEDLQAVAARLVGSANMLKDEYDGFPSDLEGKISDAAAELEKETSSLAATQAERDRIERAVEALELAVQVGEPHCPTCSADLPDASGLLAGMQMDLNTLDEALEGIRVRVRECRGVISSLNELERSRSGLKTRKDAAVEKAAAAEREALRAFARAHKVEDDAESAAETAHKDSVLAEETRTDLPELKKWESDAQSLLRKAEAAAEAESSIPEAESAVEDALEDVDEMTQKLEEAKIAAKSNDVDKARKTLDDVTLDVQAASAKVNDLVQIVYRADRDASDAEHSAEEAHQQVENRKAALAAAEEALAVASSLEDFRRDRIARLAPELSEVASDIVAIMTDGRYTSVELDEDFTPILTEAATGLQRPTAWLSGGEESAVALALRIAVGEVVSGQRAGLLVLDEALTAQDPFRRASVMGAIKALNSRQVITINHVSEATDMVDLVVYVVPDGDDAYTVSMDPEVSSTGNDSVIDDELLDER